MQPSTSSVLTTLSRQRIAEIARTAGLPLPDLTKEQQVDQLVATGRVHFRDLLAQLGRDELKAAVEKSMDEFNFGNLDTILWVLFRGVRNTV